MDPTLVTQLLSKFSNLLMLGFLGTTPMDPSVIEVGEFIEAQKIGAVLLLKRNCDKGPDALKQLTGFLQSKMPAGTEPLLIAIDGEGGKVKRLTKEHGYLELPPAKSFPEQPDSELTELLTNYAHQLKDLGINWNLAPVVDVEVETERGCIGKFDRSYSPDPKVVQRYAEMVVDAHTKQDVATCLKHWPGLGADMGDTHAGMTDLTQVWDKNRDTAPFTILIASLNKKYPHKKIAVMTAHSRHETLDPEAPSLTFSEKVIAEQRTKWGVNNLFISDDLDMGALDAYETGDKVVRALLAGNDIIVISRFKKQDNLIVDEVHDFVKAALLANDARAHRLKHRIEESFDRVQAFKKSWFEA